MSQLGIGAMLHMLSGGSEQAPDKYVGRRIVAANLADDVLRLSFADGAEIEVFDDGQSCCEHRYMTCDDLVGVLVGGELLAIEAKNGPDVEDDYGVHEQVFVEVRASTGFITIANHNEHNGYYGGFGLTIKETRASRNGEAE